MGLLKDMRALKKQAMNLQPLEYQGISGGMRAMRGGMARANEMLGAMGEDAARTAHLRANGQAGTATVSALRDTGMTINDNPVVDLDLQVTVPGAAPYAITHRQMISRLSIPSVQPGATVPVHIDPASPKSLTIG